MSSLDPQLVSRLKSLVNRDRLVNLVKKLVGIPSKTGDAKNVLDAMAKILSDDGFKVERMAAGHPSAPAVVVRLDSGKPGKTLQFNGHVDTVHLPFVPPEEKGDHITGSGSCDMKGGTCAAMEALYVLRESGALKAGSVLFTAHDLHEAPWGDGHQLDTLIREKVHGDAVLIPEYLNEFIPIAGRGGAVWKVRFHRPGEPIHEVNRPDEPNVILAGALFITRLSELSKQLAKIVDPVAGPETVFYGKLQAGEIFNQYPQECLVEGTRRWLHTSDPKVVERDFRAIAEGVGRETGASVDFHFQIIRGAFKMDSEIPFVKTFQQAYQATAPGRAPLPYKAKKFIDDGNSFWSIADVPAITHGPNSHGAHTLDEWVSIEDLQRVAHLYALTAVQFCSS